MRLVLFLLGVVLGAALLWAVGAGTAAVPGSRRSVQDRHQGWARVETAPDDPTAWAALGDQQATAGHVERAARTFATAVALAPEDAALRARYGFLLYELGDDERALAQLRRARDLGSTAAMLGYTITTLGADLDDTGPFPRFVDRAAGHKGPKVARVDVADRPSAMGEQHRGHDAAPRRSGSDAVEAPADEPSPPELQPQERVEVPDTPDIDDDPEAVSDGEELDDEEPIDEGRVDDDAPVEAEEPATVEPDPEPELIEPRPASVAARGPPACSITLRPRGRRGTFLADVVVGRREAALVFDTGATLTVITRDYAVAANVRIDDFNAITVRTANGTTRFATAVIDELVVGDLVARDIRAAVCEDCGAHGMDGLLGLDVQRQLGLSLDVSEGVARYRCD